ncbi:tRNA uridine-5-carboxymethylaminomethyl(34) synthesis enzyme MnmG [Chlorobium ferrooxidans]|uniref:tRNA uridine 5-carboxymethylaminomethyl modification enzyme MnmG n=1 Tax=Chlorobium ferrooxidans DSM 13031 TaxID=377431 RepID=Q0YQK1_9CHLB|nr:tRNA uridine-5-carboxymethylaminomethyl(34) synthesis enzyme MnmG [Chlorobium ferrooxidans]EAT58616.1 glucose inhibited division protein A [Chlorobium ferrooxidans DSM 13031]
MYDIIVAGAGHAGCEAALAAARSGCSCLLITTDLSSIARMSCNPAIGGVAKGQITREIDALGGEMARAIDANGIQFRMLNRSKGPAMHSPRAQADKAMYSLYMRKVIERETNIDLLQDTVVGIESHEGVFQGARISSGRVIAGGAAILCCGTFLNGLIHIGMNHYDGGRTTAEPPVRGLTEDLLRLGFVAGRLKTGTPPRIDARSVDYSRVESQQGDAEPSAFSFSKSLDRNRRQVSCYITKTTPQTHDILKKGFSRSPLFTGKVQGIGPRYCPSVEDKICRFPDKESHHIFLEPEGIDTNEMYVNGFSTSLPEDIQEEGLRSIPGLSNAKIIRPGYAIEYDYFFPYQIKGTLETKLIENLYFAGQINGTSGYEEAAAQGLMAGINASLKARSRPPINLRRSEAYIGVLIDDIITKETLEPYRMFTSSAEHRLHLRHDNADVRLVTFGYEAGLVQHETYHLCLSKIEKINHLKALCANTRLQPEEINRMLAKSGYAHVDVSHHVAALLKRPGITLELILAESEAFRNSVHQITIDRSIYEQVDIDLKYEGYLKRDLLMAEKISRLESLRIPPRFNYDGISGLSNEGKEKLKKHKPETIGVASRIPGVSPSDISVLTVRLGR